MKNLVICGCPFARGIGCVDLNKLPFGILLSEKLNLNHISLAKGSSSNFSIYLQAKYAVEKIKDVDELLKYESKKKNKNFFKKQNKKINLYSLIQDYPRDQELVHFETY